MIFALRSVRLGVISLVPNIAPAIIGFGLWALISGEINLGLSVVVTLTLGIVVDDAVHFLSKYQRARKEGQSAEQAVRYAFHTVGRALWITTVVLVAGFSVLALSGFRLNADMGLLSAIVIFIALVVDFILLPILLMIFDKENHYVSDAKKQTAETQPNPTQRLSYPLRPNKEMSACRCGLTKEIIMKSFKHSIRNKTKAKKTLITSMITMGALTIGYICGFTCSG